MKRLWARLVAWKDRHAAVRVAVAVAGAAALLIVPGGLAAYACYRLLRLWRGRKVPGSQ